MVATRETSNPVDCRLGVLAEFSAPHELVTAANALRLRGYKKLEAFSPFPIHGLDEALGFRPTPLPWIVLVAGILSGILALAFQWWTNAVAYPYLISGKPLFSLPANIPVMFEVIILAAAFAAFFGMLALSGLPKLSNPLFRNERFRSATNNGFFLFVDANNKQFDLDSTMSQLRELEAKHLEAPSPVDESQSLPRSLIMAGAVLGALALIPPVMIASARSQSSDKPRLHNFFDMDFQPKFKPQTSTTLFADGRAMRPRESGTVARGQLKEDSRFHLGIVLSDEQQASNPSMEASNEQGVAEPNWVTEIPLSVTSQLMDRGRERFNIHCAVCHGKAGHGNGLASLRALELEQATWVPPTSIHADHVQKQPVGQLFNTITNGVRKMPAYGDQIQPEDRWSIVLYLRALQRSQRASIDDVPEEIRPTLREMN